MALLLSEGDGPIQFGGGWLAQQEAGGVEGRGCGLQLAPVGLDEAGQLGDRLRDELCAEGAGDATRLGDVLVGLGGGDFFLGLGFGGRARSSEW